MTESNVMLRSLHSGRLSYMFDKLSVFSEAGLRKIRIERERNVFFLFVSNEDKELKTTCGAGGNRKAQSSKREKQFDIGTKERICSLKQTSRCSEKKEDMSGVLEHISRCTAERQEPDLGLAKGSGPQF